MVSVIGLLVIIAGAVLVVAGVVTYVVVSSTLADQKITVSADAAHFGGQQVRQPWQAYAQANDIAGGKTYAELPQNDPNRQTVMTASFLQASLFTSVVAFGVAVMAAGLGVIFVLLGAAVRHLGRTAAVVEPTPTTAA
jgi:hypothetical protein